MRSPPLLSSLPGPLWPGVVAPDRGPIYGLEEIICTFLTLLGFFFFFLNCVLMLN